MANKRKALSIVMVITIASKCLGFLRDMILAYFFGATTVTDAYFVAQTIPEFLFSLVVQAVAIGFIPIYMEILHTAGKEKAFAFTNNLYCLGWCLVCVLIAVVYIFTGPIVSLFASGFDATTTELAKLLVKISVFGMFFRITAAIDTAFLNANEKFTVPALTGIPLDIITIISIIFAFYGKQPAILAIGISAAAFGQMIIQIPTVRKIKPHIASNDFSFHDPHLKKMVALFLPVALGVGANQVNILVDRTLASSIVGGISALNYANKVDNILENVIILSLATVMFPTFSQHAAKNDYRALSRDIEKSLLLVAIIMLPCSAFAFIYAEEAITLLFGHGAFTATATLLTTQAMQYYSLGLLFISFNAILTRALYSLKHVKITSISTCCSVATNVVLNLLLAPLFGIRGLALATSLASFVLTLILGSALAHSIGTNYIKAIIMDILKIACGTLVLSVASTVAYMALRLYIPSLVACIISATFGIILFVGVLQLTKVTYVKDILGSTKKFLKRIL